MCSSVSVTVHKRNEQQGVTFKMSQTSELVWLKVISCAQRIDEKIVTKIVFRWIFSQNRVILLCVHDAELDGAQYIIKNCST